MSVSNKPTESLTRREILKYGLYGSLAVSLSPGLWLSGCHKRGYGKRPNIILISLDTLRADHLGCYGYDRPTSPAIDELASQGTLFEDASAPSPWTLPSHGSLLTGLYPSRLGLNTDRSRLPLNVQALATVLLEHGFATAAIVNSFYICRKFGFDKGFEKFAFVPESNQPQGTAPEIIDMALKWLQQEHRDRFFLFLHFYDVHSDYRALPRYKKQFVGSYQGIANGSTAQLIAFRKGKVLLNKNDTEHLIDLYDAEVRQLDDRLGDLFDSFRKHGLLDNGFLIVTSDHGEEFLDHGGVLHGRTQYQELIDVPLIIRGPKIPQGERINQMVSLVDVMPTVLNLLDIPAPSRFDGYDLSPLWQKTGAKLPERFIFAEADHNNVMNDIKRAVRHPQYKLHYDLLSNKYELYDLVNDPRERINIGLKRPGVVESLSQELEKFMQKGKRGEVAVPLSPENIKKLKSLGYL